AKMVVAHSEAGALTVVTAQDPKYPELGTLQLGFSANPIALRQWVVTDETGGQTRVELQALKTGQTYQSSLFSINSEVERRSRKNN
ncbi:MAG: outer-membrane lipoprotein carrier protein LolA, partial [Albidovulum sp.]